MKPIGHVLWLALLLSSACATRHEGTRPEAPAKASGITVRVQRTDSGTGTWSIRYELPSPVHTVRFTRPGHGYRQSHWKVLEPAGLAIERRGDEDLISAPADAPLRTLRLEVATYTEKPEKDYQVFIPYTDGAVLLYTGVLGLLPGEAEQPPPLHVLLTPRPGERVVVAGQSSEREVRWEDNAQGTYAYFGTSTAVQEGVTAVVDPGMPRALRERIEQLLPKLFALYTARTGSPLTFSPALFLSFGPAPRPGSISIGGGTLPGLVQLDIRLGAEHLAEGDQEVFTRVSEVVAHEAAHLWNGELASHEVKGGDWMHEGGAEAFSLRALAELGAVPEEHVRKRLSDAVSDCLLKLEGEPLRESSRPGKYTNHYRCGLLIFTVAEASARQERPKADIFTLWGRLLRDVGPRGSYDEARLYAALEAEGVSARTLTFIRQLVEGPNGDAVPRVLEELRLLGFEPRAREEPARRTPSVQLGRVPFLR
jgi:hypothetical protein